MGMELEDNIRMTIAPANSSPHDLNNNNFTVYSNWKLLELQQKLFW